MKTIWSNDVDVINSIIDDIREEYPEADDYDLYRIAAELNDDYLEDERINLNIELRNPILIIADLGLWNGRHYGYSEIESGNISDCLYSECDYATWYVDDDGEFGCKAVHHDGTNFYRYRVWKDYLSDDEKDELKDKLFDGTAEEEDIEKYTDPLGKVIGDVYGWRM